MIPYLDRLRLPTKNVKAMCEERKKPAAERIIPPESTSIMYCFLRSLADIVELWWILRARESQTSIKTISEKNMSCPVSGV
jgi:hypothetical protein